MSTLQEKATYSSVHSTDAGVEVYRSYAIIKENPKAFQSKEEVDQYLNQQLEQYA